MPVSASITLSFIAALWPFHPRQITTRAYTLPTWSFSQSTDRFTGRMLCTLFEGKRSHPQVSYANRALTFHFSRRLNTLQADYRIDGGEAHRWQDTIPTLVQIGAPLQNGSMTNPTGGLVTLPASELRSAHTISIRPTAKSQAQLFTIDGFPDALNAAESRGCVGDAFVG